MCFGILVQTRHCDRIRKSRIRLDLFTLFMDEKTHLESHKVLTPSHPHSHTPLLALSPRFAFSTDSLLTFLQRRCDFKWQLNLSLSSSFFNCSAGPLFYLYNSVTLSSPLIWAVFQFLDVCLSVWKLLKLICCLHLCLRVRVRGLSISLSFHQRQRQSGWRQSDCRCLSLFSSSPFI